MLRLHTFGGLRLEGSGGPISGPAARRRPLAVLAVIAAAGPPGITRERLVGVLWPEVPEEQGRHALAQVLYALRKDLGLPDLLEPAAPTLRLNRGLITSDVGDFGEALARGDRATAIDLHAGAFLDGVYLPQAPGFERWAEDERARLSGQFQRALDQHANELERSGDPRRAAERWRQLVALDPLATGPRLRLMRALEAAGEPASAIAEARAHTEALGRELGAGPAAEIVELERTLREAMIRARPQHPVAPSAAPPLAPEDVAIPFAKGPRRIGSRAALVLIPVAILSLALYLNSRRDAVPPVVAVGLLESHLPDDSLGVARLLGDLLATHLVQVRGLPVVGRARLLEVLGSGAEASGPGVLAGAARTAGAEELIEGVLYPDPAGFRLDLRRTRLTDGRVRDAVSATARDPVALVEAAVAALAETWQLPRPVAPLRSVTSVSLVARRFYDEGLRALYSGDRHAAHELFRLALVEDTTFAMAAFHLAQLISEAEADSAGGRWRRAVSLAERATDRERLLILATGALWVNDAQGLAYAETLAVRYPDDLDGIRVLGDLRFALGDFDAAVEAYQRVIARDSAGPRGRSALCHACEAANQAVWASLTGDSLARAERIAREMTRWPIGGATGSAVLVTVLLRRGAPAQALALAREVSRREPGVSPEAVELDGMQYAGEMPLLDSILSAQLAATRRPETRAMILERLILTRREGGRPSAARVLAAEQARTRSPEVARTAPFAHLQRALTLLELGRWDRAAARAAAALFDSMAGMPGYPEPRMARHRAWMWTHKATALALAGDTAALPALAQEIHDMAMRSSYGRDRRLSSYVNGLLLEARGDWEGAKRAYAAAVWSPTENLMASRLGRAALHIGRPRDAVRVLEAYLRGPLDAANQYVPRWEIHQLLADAYAELGLPDSARVHDNWVRRALARAEPAYRALAEGN